MIDHAETTRVACDSKIVQGELTQTAVAYTGHFHFAENRTFLLCLDNVRGRLLPSAHTCDSIHIV